MPSKKKKPLSTAELLKRNQKSVEEVADDDWEDAAAILAREQRAADEAAAVEAEAARQTKANGMPPLPNSRNLDGNDTKSQPRSQAPRKESQGKKAKERREKREAGERAQAAAAMRAAFDRNAKPDGLPVPSAADSARARALRERREQQRSASDAAKAAEAEKPILAEASPSDSNRQQPDETLEDWHAIDSGGFARSSVGFHPGVSCDRTGANPIVGQRYQLREEHLDVRVHPYGFDVCEMAFVQMRKQEQATFEAIAPTHFASDDCPLLRPLRPHFAYTASGL